MIHTYHSSFVRRMLVAWYGLPNAWPRRGESVFKTRRELFVDDEQDGLPVAFWEPREER
jgi:hypothetical protein